MKIYIFIGYIVALDNERSLLFPVRFYRMSAHGSVFGTAHGVIIGVYHNFQTERLIEHVHVTAAVATHNKWFGFDECLDGVSLPVVLRNGQNDLSSSFSLFHHTL